MKKQALLFTIIFVSVLSFSCKEDFLKDIPPVFSEPPKIDSPMVQTATEYTIEEAGGYFRLYKEGEEFYVNGGASNAFIDKIDDFGGNTIRTYSVNDTAATRILLDNAYYNGVSVMLGIWISRVRDGFDYYNEEAVKAQYDQCEAWVRQFKDHPAVMMWALGNELNTTDSYVWGKINDIGEMINRIDPVHPVTTVLPGTPIPVVEAIADSCPSFELIGINSYEGPVSNVQTKLIEAGWNKPYMVTELGQRGTWDTQVPFTSWGTTGGEGLIERTSTEKGDAYETILRNDIIPYYNVPVTCLGSFAFVWGYQDRGTVITWYSMFNRFGAALESAHRMRYMWTSLHSSNLPPRIESNTDITINGKTVFDNVITTTASINKAFVKVNDPDGDALTYEWIVTREGISFDRADPGFESSLPQFSGTILTANDDSLAFKVEQEGNYRLNCFVYDGNNNAAHASFPFRVEFKVDGARTPEAVTLYSSLTMGMQANTIDKHFLDAETQSMYFYTLEPKGIDNASVIDIAYYRSSSVGLCICNPLETTAAQYIYKGNDGFGKWSPRNNTEYVKPLPEEFDIADFNSAANDEKIYDVFYNNSPSATYKNLVVDDIVLFKTVDGAYGAILVKEFDNNTDGKVTFDMIVN